MKISTFTCLRLESPKGETRFGRAKITADVRKGTFSFYLFKGGEHTKCNHQDCAMDPNEASAFRAIYGDVFGRACI